ncbi:hypothetical protein KEM48_007266 [Puccinia striiformis f. sp. tritici PST-130]|nr:hypothetical protein KEM48_007266 [Puccinia striiformis f. sp. tritici PST-130]
MTGLEHDQAFPRTLSLTHGLNSTPHRSLKLSTSNLPAKPNNTSPFRDHRSRKKACLYSSDPFPVEVFPQSLRKQPRHSPPPPHFKAFLYLRLELTVLSFMLANTPSGRSTPPVHSYPSHSGSSPPRTLLGFDHHQLAPQYYHSLSLQASQHPHFPPTINNNLLHMTAAATALPGTSNNHSFDVNSPAPGSQNHKRPVGLTLANPNNAHGFSHYPVSAPSSSAPLPLGPPNHSPVAQLHRNASFSFSTSLPPNYQALCSSQGLASAPPSATIPLSHSASAMPILNQASQPQNHPRARQPTAQPGSAHMQGRANDTQPHGRADSPSAPSTAPARPSTSALPGGSNIPNGKTGSGSRDDSVVPPASLSNFPGLGFAVQPNSASQAKNGTQANLGSSPSAIEAIRFFNTYLYDYLLKQGLFEVARTFVASGVELDLVDGRDGLSASQPGSKPSNTHKRRRSEGSINGFHSSPQAGSNLLSTNDGANPANPKGGNAANINRSSNETPGSQGPSSDPATNPSNNTNGPNGVHTSPHTSASSRSSPLDSHTLRENLPKPKLAMDTDQGFLFEWWSIFWDVFRAKTGRAPAQSKSAQVYAQTVAAASLGMPNEPGGLTKARREALGILAVQNPNDVQKGQLNDRIQQQYTLVNPSPYSAPQQEPGNAPGARGSPHSLQGKQAQLNEQARAAQLNRLHQQQQLQRAEVARQRQQHQAPAQAQPVAQQQQEIALRAQEAQLRQPQHMHQIHPAHHDQFAHQRQMSMNARRPGMLANMSSEQAHAMMPPPPIQHGSPLNPHQQSYRPSRPPSRAGTTHVSSPFASSQVQPQRQPSRASNHASSPAMQAHPRTPSASHASTPQASAASSHTRASPAVSNGDQDRKKRRLNDPIYNPSEAVPSEPSNLPPTAQHAPPMPHQQHLMAQQQHMAQQQMAQHQQQMALQHHRMEQQQQFTQQQQLHQQHQLSQQQQLNQHHHLSQHQQMTHQPINHQQQLSQQHQLNQHHQMNQQQQPNPQQMSAHQQQQMAQMQAARRPGAQHPEFAGSPLETTPMSMSAEAYKQSIHAKQSQAMSNAGGSNGQKGNNVSSPIKEAGSKPDENAMPPPSSRNAATQPSTPQSSASANKTTESTPLPTIVAPSPNINQPLRPASRNDQNSLNRHVAFESTDDRETMSNNDTEAKPNSSSDIQHGNEATESSGGVEHTNDKSMFMTEAVSKSHDKPGGLWSMDSNGNGQQHSNMSNGGNIQSNISPQANTGTQGMNSHELTMANNNAMDQLFGTESISFDLDASLFDAFINYDHNASDLPNGDFS